MNTTAEAVVPPVPAARWEFRQPALEPFLGVKLTIAELCAECGLVYSDGKVHTPAVPVERVKHDDTRLRRVA